MPSFDDLPRSPFSPTVGLGQFTPSTRPLPTGENPAIPMPAFPGNLPQQAGNSTDLVPMPPAQWSPIVTGGLSQSSGITRTLTSTLGTGQQTTGLRTPVVIKGQKKRTALAPVSHTTHKRRRLFFSLVGMCLLFLITTGTLFAATPLGHEVGLNFNSSFVSGLFSNQNNTSFNLVVQATATATYHRQTDGYVPPGGMITNGNGSLNWPTGQCTFWANERYHTLTNHWVPWSGNADQWVSGARAAPGWNVSGTPHVPSIIVMMPYKQGASGYGHVAVVESINADGSVHASNMNWYANGGGWDRISYVDFTSGPGIYFVWHS